MIESLVSKLIGAIVTRTEFALIKLQVVPLVETPISGKYQIGELQVKTYLVLGPLQTTQSDQI